MSLKERVEKALGRRRSDQVKAASPQRGHLDGYVVEEQTGDWVAVRSGFDPVRVWTRDSGSARVTNLDLSACEAVLWEAASPSIVPRMDPVPFS